jgi:uroporphyrinogen decarboxylase
MDTGFVPLFDDFLEIGVDILSTVDPVMGGMGETTLADVKGRIGHRICLWGGVNSPHTIERGTESEVRQAVREAIEALGPGGGFVLSTADSVWDPKPEANVRQFIAAGLEYGCYPLAVVT